jgi:endonuclease YncB( thermonuclease family)
MRPSTGLRWRRRLRSLAALCFLAALLWAAWQWQAPDTARDVIDGTAAHVIDGDSLTLTFDAGALAPKGTRTIRLIGIDAPEYRQSCAERDRTPWPCGRAARDSLAALVKGQFVSCTLVARDQYQRDLGRCATATSSDIGRDMVRAGWAVSNAGIASASGYPLEEAQAARDKAGIWRGSFQTPRNWRDANSLLNAD